MGLNHSFFSSFFFLNLFSLKSVMMDGPTKCGLLWASAALKCMDKWEGVESRQRDGIEGLGQIYEKKAESS